MGLLFSKPKPKEEDEEDQEEEEEVPASAIIPPESVASFVQQLPNELIIKILEFCDDQAILERSQASLNFVEPAQYVLQQRLLQEFDLFGITKEQLNLQPLTVLQLYQLRKCLWIMENHDALHAQVLRSKATTIQTLLQGAINKEYQPNIANYLYSIFSALAAVRIPVLEQLPAYLAILKANQARLPQRLLAIYHYAQNNADCMPIFQKLAQSDPVANWYLFQINRLGTCNQIINIPQAMYYFKQIPTQCMLSPEFSTAYKQSLSNKCVQSLAAHPQISQPDQAILALAQTLPPHDKDQFVKMLTSHHKRLTN